MSAQELVERALASSRTEGCIVLVSESRSANLRWAGNTLTTNGVMRSHDVTVVATAAVEGGTAAGVVTRSGVTVDLVEDLVRAAEASSRDAGPAEDAQPFIEGVPASPDWQDLPAETSASVFVDFAPALGEAFAKARSEDRELFGFAEHEVSTTYLGSSTGLRLRHVQPQGKFEMTGKSDNRTRSTWVGQATRDFSDVDVALLDEQVRQRLAWQARKVEVDAGRYTTVLPPTALADLMVYMYWSAGAKEAAEGRTVFSKPGGGTRIGERLSSQPVTLSSDPRATGLQCAPFVLAHASGPDSSVFDNGLPLGATSWIRDGSLAALISSRHSAAIAGVPVTPGIDNLTFATAAPTSGAGAPSLEQMIASTGRGLLLTCLWYIREVDPQTLLLTGLTRDGVYLVEDGEVVGAVNNFRFNESPVGLLGRLAEVGGTVPALPREWSGYFTRSAMPPGRFEDFNMSSVSQAS